MINDDFTGVPRGFCLRLRLQVHEVGATEMICAFEINTHSFSAGAGQRDAIIGHGVCG